MSIESRDRQPNDLSESPNIKAYETAVKAGTFNDLKPGTFVAYHNGKFVGSAENRDQLFKELRESGVEGFFFHQVGVPEEIIFIPTPLSIVNIE